MGIWARRNFEKTLTWKIISFLTSKLNSSKISANTKEKSSDFYLFKYNLISKKAKHHYLVPKEFRQKLKIKTLNFLKNMEMSLLVT